MQIYANKLKYKLEYLGNHCIEFQYENSPKLLYVYFLTNILPRVYIT